MKTTIQHLTGSIRPDLDVHCAAKSSSVGQAFFVMKDRIPNHLQSNTVNATACKDCADNYVWMTKRQAITRLRKCGAPKVPVGRPNDDRQSNHTTTERKENIDNA
jgi:hypothetical protein